jgi:hypothetical protein
MKAILGAVVLISSSFASLARGEVLYDQPLESWDAGWCSSCLIPREYRQYASFTLPYDSVVQSGRFAVFDFTPSPNNLSFTIWDEPFGNLLHSLEIPKGAYDVDPPSSEKYWATVNFPDWQLDAGSYWISMLSIDGDIGWGTDYRRGDDRQYELDGSLNQPINYVGFSLSGLVVPEPSTLAMLTLAGLFARRTRRY